MKLSSSIYQKASIPRYSGQITNLLLVDICILLSPLTRLPYYSLFNLGCKHPERLSISISCNPVKTAVIGILNQPYRTKKTQRTQPEFIGFNE